MSKTITVEDLKTELGFLPDECVVSCRDLGYGYQLVFDFKEKEFARIFIQKHKEAQ